MKQLEDIELALRNREQQISKSRGCFEMNTPITPATLRELSVNLHRVSSVQSEEMDSSLEPTSCSPTLIHHKRAPGRCSRCGGLVHKAPHCSIHREYDNIV